MAELVRYYAMRSAIVAAHTVDEVKDIRDRAVALEYYARQACDLELERWVRDIRIRAERRTGELLKETPKATGTLKRGDQLPQSVETTTGKTPTLAEIGITKDQSSRFQKLADVPEVDFEKAMANTIGLPSTDHIIAGHEAKTTPQSKLPPVDDAALWLWGRLNDFERDGILDRDPDEVCEIMLPHMIATVRDQAPKVATWLQRITK